MAMNANIVVSLDTRRPKKDGTYPLIMRLGVHERTIPIPLGYSVKEDDWDEHERKVKNSYKGTETVKRLNNLIQKKKTNALDIVMKLEETGELKRLSVAEVKDRISSIQVSGSVFKYAEAMIEDMRKAKRFNTARSYCCVLSVLEGFIGKRELAFNAITFQFLNRLEASHLSKDRNGLNGLAVYMRTIRAIYNHAVKAGAADRTAYPFSIYQIKTEETKKRALEVDLVHAIMDLKIDPNEKLFHTRNYFVASYLLNGMNFKDMAFLKKENITHGRLDYSRGKTSKQYNIKIFPALQEILDFYISAYPESELVFPILSENDDLEAQTRTVEWARKRYNTKLKLLANKCDIKTNLTSYVSRHSFATHALWQEIPVAAISAMLGHSSIKTTQTYLKGLPSNTLDAYHEKVISRNSRSPK